MLEELKNLYEDENIVIENADDKKREQILKMIKDNGFKYDDDKIILNIYKLLTLAKDEKYDFNLFELEDFIELINNPNKYNYKNIKTISNIISNFVVDIITDYLENLLITSKEERIRILSLENEIEFNKMQTEKYKYEKMLRKNKKGKKNE